MVLDEALYDPILPEEERGKDAWDRTKPKRRSLGKRSREDSTSAAEGGKRKLRRTASTKLRSQNDRIWGDIVGGGGTALQVSRSGMWDAADETPAIPNNQDPRSEPDESADPPTLPNAIDPQPPPVGLFSRCRFYFRGFGERHTQVLRDHLLPQNAEISTTLDELLATKHSPVRMFVIVPNNLPVTEHPVQPNGSRVELVTEWWVERCLHHKKFMDPRDHVIGRPFPFFPIAEFKEMTITLAAFTGIDRLHVIRAIEQLGATYSEEFTRHSSILLTKTTSALRKDKMEGALGWKVPIVHANWLWDSIEAGTRLPLQKYQFRGQNRAGSVPGMTEKPTQTVPEVGRSKSKTGCPAPQREKSSSAIAQPRRNARLDNTAFLYDEPAPPFMKEEIDSQNPQTIAQASGSTSGLSSKSEPLSEINLNSPTRTVSTAPAPSDHPYPRPPKDDISNAISDLLAKTKSTTQPLHSDAPEGRKRGANRILGRAASNVSTASTPFSRATSVESTGTHGQLVEHAAGLPHSNPALSKKGSNPMSEEDAARRTANEKIEKFLQEGNAREEEEEEERPLGTQLQYEDAESREYKERVMARMLGKKVDEKKVHRRERVATIADGGLGVERPRRRGRLPTGGLR